MISVVIPSYNRRDCILALLRDLRIQTYRDLEVIVVDDQSPDDTVAMVSQMFPDVRLLVNERNGGPCVTRNRGILAARGEIIVGLDSDVTVPDVHFIARIAGRFDMLPQATGFAFRLFKPDGVTEDAERWWHPRPIASGARERFETSYFSGTAYAFRKDAMIRAGLFPEFFYMHYEEVALALRIIDQGGGIYHEPEISVLHHANPVSRRGEIEIYYKPRNQVLIAWCNLPVFAAIRYALPRMTYQGLKSLAAGHGRDFLRALKDAFLMLKGGRARRIPISRATLERISCMGRARKNDSHNVLIPNME